MQEWFALYVKSKHEFVTDSALKEKNIETFLPSIPKRRQWKDRQKTVEFPLFPGYLFVHLQPRSDEFMKVLKTKGAVTFVSLDSGVPTPVNHEEFSSLRLMIESGKELDIYPHLKEGSHIRIRRGPLKGADGFLLKKEANYMFIVNINLLGRSIGLNISSDDVEDA
ncbi:MAG: UpxY family transcription antiterminator [Nitrospirota bacterium]